LGVHVRPQLSVRREQGWTERSENPAKVAPVARDDKSLSKFLSLILRHDPSAVGISLDPSGWVEVDPLLQAIAQHGQPIDRARLESIVVGSDKQRFALSADGAKIRASQGHSVEVELGYSPRTPPAVLYHGTVERFLPSIRERGLLKGRRHHVHLSATRELAVVVGSRRGRPVVLRVDAAAMAEASHDFFCSANGVWLTEHVPASFLRAEPVTD
jgi:putative RNA 2'-phosphotransferase